MNSDKLTTNSSEYENTLKRNIPDIPSYNNPGTSKKDIYEELGLPKFPSALPTLQSYAYQNKQPGKSLETKICIESYLPPSLIPDYKNTYVREQNENANPNINPLKNQILNAGKTEVFNADVDSILNPSEGPKPYNYSEQPSWRGNLSNNKYPSDLNFSPIGSMGEDKPFVPPQPTGERNQESRINGICPTQLDWNSSDTKSQAVLNMNANNDDDEDEEEQEPRSLPIHIVNHMAQYQAAQPQHRYQAAQPQNQYQAMQSQNQYQAPRPVVAPQRIQIPQQPQAQYQMQQVASPPKPMCFADVLRSRGQNIPSSNMNPGGMAVKHNGNTVNAYRPQVRLIILHHLQPVQVE